DEFPLERPQKVLRARGPINCGPAASGKKEPEKPAQPAAATPVPHSISKPDKQKPNRKFLRRKRRRSRHEHLPKCAFAKTKKGVVIRHDKTDSAVFLKDPETGKKYHVARSSIRISTARTPRRWRPSRRAHSGKMPEGWSKGS